ncbi:MAG: hypothetical protein ACJ71Z_08035 [Aeromicrobium sp.]
MRIRGDAGVAPFAPDVGGSIQAKRLDVRPWRDPRAIVGVVLVLASTVMGGLALAAADHSESYWAVSRDVRAGDPVRRHDLVAVRARVPGRTASGLLRTDHALPGRLAELRWAADGRAGTLVTSSTLVSRRHIVELPMVVGTGGAPGDLRSGDRVDIWSVPDARTGEPPSDDRAGARRLMAGARVVSTSSATGMTGGPSISLVVDAAGTTLDARLMSALSTGRLTVVRVS